MTPASADARPAHTADELAAIAAFATNQGQLAKAFGRKGRFLHVDLAAYRIAGINRLSLLTLEAHSIYLRAFDEASS